MKTRVPNLALVLSRPVCTAPEMVIARIHDRHAPGSDAAVRAFEDEMGITALKARFLDRGKGKAIVLRATSKKLDAPPENAPVWEQIAKEGEYKGHASGEFTLDAQVFADIIKNFRAHPSYRAADVRTPWTEGGDNSNSGRVIPWDFHHANEAAPTSVAVQGAPAQGWVLDLKTEQGPDGLTLWALTDWLEPARTYIRNGQYQWSSVAIWPDSHDAVTGKPIGTYLSSVAITNDPFIQGMQPLAASRGAASDRRTKKLDARGPSLDAINRALQEALELRYPSAPNADWDEKVWVCEVFDATCVFEWDGKLYEIAYTLDGTTATLGPQPQEVVRTYEPVTNTTPTPATEASTAGRRIAASRSLSTTKGQAMKLAAKLAAILGVSNAIILNAREDDPTSVAQLEAGVLQAATDNVAQLKALIAQMSQIVGAMGVPADAPPAATAARVAELVQSDAELKKIQPEIAAFKAEQAAADEAAIGTDVEIAIAAHRLDDATRPALLFFRKSDKAAFAKAYPPPADAPANMKHITRALVTDPGANNGQARALSIVHSSLPQQQPVQLGGAGQHGAPPVTEQQLAVLPGNNLVERCVSYVRQQAGNVQLSYEDAHQRGCALARQIRQRQAG